MNWSNLQRKACSGRPDCLLDAFKNRAVSSMHQQSGAGQCGSSSDLSTCEMARQWEASIPWRSRHDFPSCLLNSLSRTTAEPRHSNIPLRHKFGLLGLDASTSTGQAAGLGGCRWPQNCLDSDVGLRLLMSSTPKARSKSSHLLLLGVA